MLRQPCLNLPQVHILTREQHLTDDTLVPVSFAVFDGDVHTSDGFRQVFAGFPAIRLFTLRRIDALEADAVLGVAGIQHIDGVAIGDLDYLAGDGVGIEGESGELEVIF